VKRADEEVWRIEIKDQNASNLAAVSDCPETMERFKESK
jgi:hypothetical protein